MTAAVLLVACSSKLAEGFRVTAGAPVEQFADPEAAADRVSRSPSDAAVVVIGPHVPAPVEAAQRIGTADSQVAVVVLATEEQLAERVRDLQFAPFLGEDVVYRSVAYPDAVVAAAVAAADRTRRRRAHRATMQSAAAQLGQGPRLSGITTTAESLGTLLEQAPVGVVTVDDQARVVSLNRYADRLLGTGARAVGRWPLVDAFPASEQSRLSVMLAPSTPLFPSPTRRFRREDADGRPQELDITAARFASVLGLRGTILLLQDVTEASSTARERQRQARALQDGVIATLTAAHEAAADGDVDRAGRLVGRALEHSRALAAQLAPEPSAL